MICVYTDNNITVFYKTRCLRKCFSKFAIVTHDFLIADLKFKIMIRKTNLVLDIK